MPSVPRFVTFVNSLSHGVQPRLAARARRTGLRPHLVSCPCIGNLDLLVVPDVAARRARVLGVVGGVAGAHLPRV